MMDQQVPILITLEALKSLNIKAGTSNNTIEGYQLSNLIFNQEVTLMEGTQLLS
jgi:hypothetical protein